MNSAFQQNGRGVWVPAWPGTTTRDRLSAAAIIGIVYAARVAFEGILVLSFPVSANCNITIRSHSWLEGLMHRYAWFAIVSALFLSINANPACADNRVALVIGNGAYAHAPHLPNPPHDADDVAAALKRTGFQIIEGTNLDQAGMQDAAIRFARAARTADVAVFYYSGHAMQYAGVNYLVPIDAELHDEADLRRMARVDDILGDLQQAKNLRILVLDSCRDNPLADELKRSIGRTRSASVGRGLAKMESPNGTIISYSTQAGSTAMDGDGRNSPYTTAFLRHIEDKEEVSTVFHRISSAVYENTSGTQTPELSLSFFGEFYLNGKLQVTATPGTAPAPVDPCGAAESHWKSAEAIGTVDAYQDHLERFPNCTFAGLARARMASLNSKVAVVAPPAPPPAAPAAPRSEAALTIDRFSIDDLAGKWCGEATDYTFARNQFVVTPKKNQDLTYGTKLVIERTTPAEDGALKVVWHSGKKDEVHNTTFKLSSDRRQLFQQQEKNVAARTFRRC